MSFNDKIMSMTQEALEKIRLLVWCQTCGEIFLEIKAIEYFVLSSHFKVGTPDKWFIETGIHWVENDGHLIIIDFIKDGNAFYQEDISQIWQKKLDLDRSRNAQATKEFQRPQFYKYREQCKDKTI